MYPLVFAKKKNSLRDKKRVNDFDSGRSYQLKCLKLYRVSGRNYVIPVVQGPNFFQI
jgi:hypothetical protein